MRVKISREEVLKNRKRMMISWILAFAVGLISYVVYGTMLATGIGIVVGFLVSHFQGISGMLETFWGS